MWKNCFALQSEMSPLFSVCVCVLWMPVLISSSSSGMQWILSCNDIDVKLTANCVVSIKLSGAIVMASFQVRRIPRRLWNDIINWNGFGCRLCTSTSTLICPNPVNSAWDWNRKQKPVISSMVLLNNDSKLKCFNHEFHELNSQIIFKLFIWICIKTNSALRQWQRRGEAEYDLNLDGHIHVTWCMA